MLEKQRKQAGYLLAVAKERLARLDPITKMWADAAHTQAQAENTNIADVKQQDAYHAAISEAEDRNADIDELMNIDVPQVSVGVLERIYWWALRFRIVAFVDYVLDVLTFEFDHSAIKPYG